LVEAAAVEAVSCANSRRCSEGEMADARQVSIGPQALEGFLAIPERARGLVIFAHGSGSGRLSPRNAHAARTLQERGFATLLFDLLTAAESADRRNVFNIELLASRVVEAIEWARMDASASRLPIGLFGASTGAAAAITAAALRPREVQAVVSRGGRPDLVGAALERIQAPTLLIVGGEDREVLRLNDVAQRIMRGATTLRIVPGAGHLFEEPGALDEALAAAGEWFEEHIRENVNGRAALS
jgi:pimeloyl-ACP methyl ester carboxylesterase